MKTRKYLWGQSIRPTVDLSLLAPNLEKLEEDATILNYLINQEAEKRYLLQLLNKLNTSEIPVVFNSSGEHINVLPRTIGLKSISPEFAAFSLGAGLANGAAQRTFPYVLKGIQTLFKGITPSTYLGSGYYNTVLGGNNVSLSGALADAALLSKMGVESINEFSSDPNTYNGAMAALTVVPGMGSGSSKILVLKIINKIRALKQMNKNKEAKEIGTLLYLYMNEKNANLIINNVEDFFNTEGKKYRTLLEIFNSIGNGSKAAKDAIKKASELDSSNGLELQLKNIRDKYAKAIEKSKNDIKSKYGAEINWSDLDNSIMSSMPTELKMSFVGKDKDNRFIKRYYDNVMKIISNDGIQSKLLSSGELRVNPTTKLWEGLFLDGKYYKVEPTEYIKTKIALEKGIELGLPKNLEPGVTHYLYHGTKNKDINYLTSPKDVAGASDVGEGLWTIMLTKDPSSGRVIKNYKGTGYSVPIFRLPKYESEDTFLRGVGNSNSIYGSGRSLLDELRLSPGKILRATGVSDGTYGGNLIEYNFGRDVPNPKSMWNTLDFEPGAGPLAYNNNLNNQNNLA